MATQPNVTKDASAARSSSPDDGLTTEASQRTESKFELTRSALNANASSSSTLESMELMKQLNKLADSATDPNAFYSSLFSIACSQVDCLGMWHISMVPDEDNSSGTSAEARAISDDNANVLWEVLKDDVAPIVESVYRWGVIASQLVPPGKSSTIVAAPIGSSTAQGGQPLHDEILLATFSVGDQSTLRQQWLMGILAQTARLWQHKRLAEKTSFETRSLSDSLVMVQEVSETQTASQSAIVLVNRLRKLFAASQVAFATSTAGNSANVIAVSDVEQFDHNAQAGKLLSSAIQQATISGNVVCWPATDPQQPFAHTMPLQEYAKSVSAASVIALPLAGREAQTAGALLISRSQAELTEQQFAYISGISQLGFQQYQSVSRANRSLTQLLCDKLRPSHWSKLGKLATLLLAIGLLIPMPYRVQCDCRVEPTARRYVAAPYNGILEQALVESGEIVSQGQVIARMDGRQLRIELAGMNAEYQGAKRKRDSSLAIGEVAQSQIAKSQMRSLAAKIELTKNRMKDLEVRSPIAGIIISGDLEKAQGAPLETGQTLFEVAPLDAMVAEIHVPESEIQYINHDDRVTLKLNAFPFQTFDGQVQRIHPGSEIIDDQTVFVTEVELENGDRALRPGMEGAAKISTHWSPLGWNLFHNAWESVRCWTIW